MIGLLFGVADATPVNPPTQTVTICAEYRLNYTDSGFGEDYLTQAVHPAWGARLRLRDAATGAPILETFADWTDPNPGCVDLSLSTSTSYQVQILSQAQINGSTIDVRKDDVGNQIWASAPSASFTPSPLVTHVTVQTGLHRAWRVSAAMGLALRRRNGGVSGAVYLAHTCPCPGPNATDCTQPAAGGNCTSRADGRIYVETDQQKFIIAHEMGHAVAWHKTSAPPNMDYGMVSADCPDAGLHGMETEEWEGAALVEGLAHYYSAIAFNNTNGSDCWVVRPSGSQDWDHDGNPDLVMAIACDVGFDDAAGQPLVNDTDYIGQYCSSAPGDATYNRGTPYDWLRTFWDIDTLPDDMGNQPIAFWEILNMYDASSPTTWQTNVDDWGFLFPGMEMWIAALNTSQSQGDLVEFHMRENGTDHTLD